MSDLVANKAPDPYFTTSSGQEIFMSYGLLNRIARIINSVENVGLLLVDMTVQAICLCIALSTYDAKGKLVEEVDADSIMLSPEESIRLIAWLTEHLTSFFLQTLRTGEQTVAQFQTKTESNLKPSTDGSTN